MAGASGSGARKIIIGGGVLLGVTKYSDGASGVVGQYRKVKGHHIHAKAGFKGHGVYDSGKGFSISLEYMKRRGWRHEIMTAKQRELYANLARSGLPNTMEAHSIIAVESLVAGGAPRSEAIRLVEESISNLRKQGVQTPSHIPWSK